MASTHKKGPNEVEDSTRLNLKQRASCVPPFLSFIRLLLIQLGKIIRQKFHERSILLTDNLQERNQRRSSKKLCGFSVLAAGTLTLQPLCWILAVVVDGKQQKDALLQWFGELCVIYVAVIVFVIVLQNVIDESNEFLLFHWLAALSSLLNRDEQSSENDWTFLCAGIVRRKMCHNNIFNHSHRNKGAENVSANKTVLIALVSRCMNSLFPKGWWIRIVTDFVPHTLPDTFLNI